MTDAEKREKVIWGLKACNRKSYNGSDCQNCPYYDDEDTAELPFGICNIQDMFDDALALLKEQEPQVLTLDQVCGGDECWIEYRYGGHGYADVYLEELDGTAKVYRCRPVGDRKPETVWFHDYGKLWRGWSYRPTLEQMRDTPWEGEEDNEA